MRPLFILFLPFILLSCDQLTGPAPAGAYKYASYDSSGTQRAYGWLTMNFTDSTITGEWHFKATGNSENIGPQVGDGKLVGGVENGQTWVELNPQYRDNNLELVGTIQDGRFSGRWMWISFVGVTNAGMFVAVKN